MSNKGKVLENWRVRQGLTPSEVDKAMGWNIGKTIQYEKLGFLRVPCCDLYRLAGLYHVPMTEFYELLNSETKKWLKR